MKKIISLLIFLSLSNLLMAQQIYTSSNPQYNWGAWKQAPCYRGIYIRVQKAYYNTGSKAWYWNWEMQNRYSVKIAVSWVFYNEAEGEPQYTNARHTFLPNEKLTNGHFGGENVINYKFDNACFAFKNYNGTILDDCSSDPATYKTGYFYADCDNGIPNYKKYSGETNSSNNTNNSNTTSNNTNTSIDGTKTNNNNNPSGQSTQSLLDELNKLCAEASAIQYPYTQTAVTNYCTGETYNDTESGRAKIIGRIGYLKEAIEKGKGKVNAEAEKAKKAAEDQAEKERKAAEEKNNRYQTYMSDGESALSNEKYDEALQNFQNAESEASNDGQLQAARNAYARAQKAKEDAARRVRVAAKEEVEKKQNDATTAAIGGFAGAMALVKDNYSNGKFAAKFQVGLGYGSVPLIVNSAKQIKSTIKSNNQILFHLGFNLTVLNTKGISFELKPSLGIGLSSYQKGSDGGGEEYGGTGILWLAPKAKSTFKAFAEGGYFFRNGTYNYDQDVALGPTSATDNVEKGEFKYKVLKYGGGFKISFVNDEYLESYIKPGLYLETPSFFSKTTKPTMVFNLQAYILSNALIDFSYAKNYYIPGKLDYSGNFKKENKNYFSIKIIRQGKLK